MIYCKLLVFGLKCTGFNFDQFLTDEIFDDLQSKIEGLIEKTGVNLVIFVNDIVRVREKPDPLQRVQLVKHLGKFKKQYRC